MNLRLPIKKPPVKSIASVANNSSQNSISLPAVPVMKDPFQNTGNITNVVQRIEIEGELLQKFIAWVKDIAKEKHCSPEQTKYAISRAKGIAALSESIKEAESKMEQVFERIGRENKINQFLNLLSEKGGNLVDYVLDCLLKIGLNIPTIADKYVSPFLNGKKQLPDGFLQDVIKLVRTAVTDDIHATIPDKLLLKLIDSGNQTDKVALEILGRIDKFISANLNFGKYFGRNQEEIPKYIHFIWSGREISKPALANILEWAKKAENTPWQVFLWSDLKISNWTNALPFLTRAGIKLIDATSVLDERFTAPYKFAREYNLAGASDLIRLSILKIHGGIYSDVDIGPGDIDLNKLNPNTSPLSLPLFGPLVRDIEGVRSVLKKGKHDDITNADILEAVAIQTKLGSINNNFIIAHPRCMFLEPVINHIQQELSKPEYGEYFWKNAGSMIATITGPGVIMGVLQKMVAMRDGLSIKEADQFLTDNFVCKWLLKWLTAESEDKDWTRDKK